jgi:hypothetical protein
MTQVNRRQLLIGAGMGAIGTAAALGAAPAEVFAAEENDRVEGSWWVTVHVASPPNVPDFDVTYGFAKGGVFTRIDGRNNAPSLGTWKRSGDGTIVIVLRVFHFTAGVRDATIFPVFIARVENRMLTGTWTAIAHPLPGFPNPAGFPSSGTFSGTRIVPAAS